MKEELIIKYLNGDCTQEELLIVKSWINDPRFKEQFEDILRSRWETFSEIDFPESQSKSVDKMLHNIRREIKPERKINFNQLHISEDLKHNFWYYLKLVACLLIFPFTYLLLLAYYNMYENKPSTEEVVEILWIKKSAQIGEKRNLRLADGTLVNLNSGSSIDYPEIFSDSIRLVKLSGEAFFEVVSDQEKPFIVKTEAATTTVLGTAFNIKDRDGLAEITLTEGEIKVEVVGKDRILKPGEMAMANTVKGELAVEEVDIKEVTNWKNGIISFKNMPLKAIYEKLENWYGVKIMVEKGLQTTEKISGEFNNENLDNILSGLSFLFDFEYKITGKEVSISKKIKK